MLTDVLTVSYLRTWRDSEGVTHTRSETVTVDIDNPSDTRVFALVSLLDRLYQKAQKGHDRNRVGTTPA